MARRKTTDDDIERLAENLLISEGDFIQDRDSFDLALSRYAPEANLSKNSKDQLFKEVQNQKPGVSSERLFTKAGGKDLARDRRKTARTVVKTREEFIKKGAKRVDFAGFDIKESEIRKQKLTVRKEFKIPAKVKTKVVFSKRVTVTIKGKRFVRHRDKLGRFASVRS